MLTRRGVGQLIPAPIPSIRLEIREMSPNPSLDPLREGDPSQDGQGARPSPVPDSDLWRQIKLRDEQAIADIYDRYSQL